VPHDVGPWPEYCSHAPPDVQHPLSHDVEVQAH